MRNNSPLLRSPSPSNWNSCGFRRVVVNVASQETAVETNSLNVPACFSLAICKLLISTTSCRPTANRCQRHGERACKSVNRNILGRFVRDFRHAFGHRAPMKPNNPDGWNGRNPSQIELWPKPPRLEYGRSDIPGVRKGWRFFDDGKMTLGVAVNAVEKTGGKVYYQFKSAAKVIGVNQNTLRNWANKGISSTGVRLEVYIHGTRLDGAPYRLLPEETVFALRDAEKKRRQNSIT